MEAVARHQALSIKENGKAADEMDVTYITERIIVLLYHASSGHDSAYKSSFSEASAQLRLKHNDNCLIVNLSEKRSDMHKWHKNVLDFGWPELLAPPLERLCNICKSLDSWLSSDPGNVIALHCKGGIGRVAVVIAAYIDYSKICASSDQASDQLALKRFYQQKVSTSPEPSQLRYVHYFVGLLSGAVKINNQPLYLHQIIISGVPQGPISESCSLYFKIYQNMQPVYISQVYSASKSKSSHINVALSPSLQLRGDVIVKCFQQTSDSSSNKPDDHVTSNSSLIFFCQYHTCAVTNNSLKFSRSDLDIACHNNSVTFPKDGVVEFNFSSEEGTQESTGYDLVGKSDVRSENLLNVDELVRANSYENFNQFSSSKESLLEGDTLGGKGKSGGGGRMYGMDGPVDGNIYSTRSTNSRKESSTSRDLQGSRDLRGVRDHQGTPDLHISEHNHRQHSSLSSTGARSRTDGGMMYNGYDGKFFPPLNDSRRLDSSINYTDDTTMMTSGEVARRGGEEGDQSQLDDILNELMTEQLNLSLDGRESRSTTDHYPDTRCVDRTLSTLPPQRGTITTEGDHSRSVLSWATSQAGPKRTVMVSRQTLAQPSPHHRIHTESSRYYESSSTRGRSHSSLGHSLTGPSDELVDMPSPGAEDDMYMGRREGKRPTHWQDDGRKSGSGRGRYSSGNEDIDWDEVMRNSSATQNRRVEERRTESYKSAAQRGSSPPTPPLRRRIMSPDSSTGGSRGPDDAPLLYSTPNRYRNYASDSEEPMSWLDKQRTKLRSKRSSTKPWLKENRPADEQAVVSELEFVQTRRRAQSDTEELATPEPARYQSKSTTSKRYETRTEYQTSGGDQSSYRFNTSPSYSTSALHKPLPSSLTPESTLRGATSQNLRQNYETSTNQRFTNSSQKLQVPSLVEVEQEVISLQPIGPGVQNLEPRSETRTLSRSNTPAFPSNNAASPTFPGSPLSAYDNKGYQLQQQHQQQLQQQQLSRMSNSTSVPASLALQESEYAYTIESARTLGKRHAIPQSYTTLNTSQGLQGYTTSQGAQGYTTSQGPQGYSTTPQQRQGLQAYNTTEQIVTQTTELGGRRVPMMPRSQSAMGGEIKYMTQQYQPFSPVTPPQQQQQLIRQQGYSSSTLLPGTLPHTSEGLEAIRLKQQRLLQQKQLLEEQERQLMIEQHRIQQQTLQQPAVREIKTVHTETRTVNNQQPFQVQQQQQSDSLTQQRGGFTQQQQLQHHQQQQQHQQQHGYSHSLNQQQQQHGYSQSLDQQQLQQQQQHGYSQSLEQRSRGDVERDIESIMSGVKVNEPVRSASPVYSSVKPNTRRQQQQQNNSGWESEIVVESANQQFQGSTAASAGRQVQGSTTGRGYASERQEVEEEIVRPVKAAVCGARDMGVPPLSVVLGEKLSSSARAQSGATSVQGYELRTNVSGNTAYMENSLVGQRGVTDQFSGQRGVTDQFSGQRGVTEQFSGQRGVTDQFSGQRGVTDQLMIDTQNLSGDSTRSQGFYTSTMIRGDNRTGSTPHQLSGLSPNLYRSHSRTASMASGIDGFDTINQTPRFVRDTSKYWHKPNITRDEAIALLRDQPPGSFVVRNSSTFQGAFGLAVKVDQLPPNVQARSHGDIQAELVRHFLIEPTSKGVRLKGCSNEPTFGSLAALVYQHTITPLALPCKLVLPQSDELQLDVSESFNSTSASSPGSLGAACNVLYLNSVDTESLTGPEAVSRAIEATFTPKHASPRTSVVHFKVSNEGVTLTDVKRRLFFRRHYPIESVTYCGVDSRDRRFEIKLDDGSTVTTGRLFGFVAHKPSSTLGIVDNSCHLFAELDPSQPASAIASFVTKLMTGGGSSSVGGTRTESFSSSSRVVTSGASRGILRSQ